MAGRWCAFAIAAVVATWAIGCGDKQREVPAAGSAPAKPTVQAPITSAKVTGSVVDRTTGKPVGDVDVVLRGTSGDTTVHAAADGAFEIHVAPGGYRAFVRAENVMSVGLSDRVRLDVLPRRELVGAIDEALMPYLDVRGDLDGVELGVQPVAQLTGVVIGPDDGDLAGAIVRLRSVEPLANVRRGAIDALTTTRPVLGTDVAISDEQGKFVLKVPPGNYALEATHPAYAGTYSGEDFELRAGEKDEVQVMMRRGCVISGRVVNADGSPANDGAIERLAPRAITADGFGPSGRIDAGTFRWVTLEDETVTLRAWPWHSPPSPPKTFDCANGKRFNDVVLRLPDQRPDLSGWIVDANDQPVPLAYLDVQPLDPNVRMGQQERGDAAGSWHVYDLPPSRYRITATAPGLGVVDTVTTSPRADVRLTLGGTGRIVGTTTDLASGSVEVTFVRCGSKDEPLRIAHEPRVVAVHGGHFTIERAPACTLTLSVRWRDSVIETSTVVEPNRTAYVDVDIGAPREKTVTGTVRDASGHAVEGARVTAVLHEREAATARTDADGKYTLQTHGGAQLVAGKGEHTGHGVVGRANVATEQVDLVLDDAGY